MILWILIASALFGTSVYYLTTALLDIPTLKTSKMMMLAKRQHGSCPEKAIDAYITRIASWFAPHIHMDPLRRSRLQKIIDIAEMGISPEVYAGRAFVKAGLCFLSSIPLLFLQPLLAVVVIAMAVALWFSTYYQVFDEVKKRRKYLEAEIPRFAQTIAQSLEQGRDVLKILTGYRRVAGHALRKELDVTIADMKTGSYETALLRFESRINSPMLSDVVRGLIGTLRGDDERMFFKMVCFDMRQIERDRMKKEINQRPAKMQRYSMYMLFCILIIYGVVLCSEVISSVGSFF